MMNYLHPGPSPSWKGMRSLPLTLVISDALDAIDAAPPL